MKKKFFRWVSVSLGCIVLGYSFYIWWTRDGLRGDAPRIGVSVSDAWYDDMGFHRVGYDVAVARAGGRVVSLRPSEHAGKLDELVAGLDGIILAGGGDIEPALYGGITDRAKLVDEERDRFELELLKMADKHDVPVVGICRGIQLMAVAYGGEIRDLRDEGDLVKIHGITLKSMSAHFIDVTPATKLSDIIGSNRYKVNSFHAQAVKSPGRMRVCAKAPDGVIEGVELPGPRLVLGIQWHPEILGFLDATQHAIIEALVHEAETYQTRREAR